jgi:hypothetical protein
LLSLTLLVPASSILIVELFRAGGFYPRIALALALVLFSLMIQHLAAKFCRSIQPYSLAVPAAYPAIKRVDLFIYML